MSNELVGRAAAANRNHETQPSISRLDNIMQRRLDLLAFGLSERVAPSGEVRVWELTAAKLRKLRFTACIPVRPRTVSYP